MIKIHAHIPEQADGTSWYRGAGPLRALERARRDEIQVTIWDASQKVDWYNLADADVVFLQRPFSPKCAEFYGIGELFQAGTICDWDDCFETIHPSNPTRGIYVQPNVKAIVTALKQQCGAAWTTTEHLQQNINSAAGKAKAQIIPNAWPDQWLQGFTAPGENNSIYWRGGSSHLGDLLEFAPAIGKIGGQFPLWSFVIAGDPAWPIGQHVPAEKLTYLDWLPAPLFAKSILQLAPGIVIVPLQDTPFNRSKSNIAWMEGVAAGAVVVCPDWPEWRKPGTIRYQSVHDFFDKLKEALSMPRKQRHAMALEGQEYVREHLLLSKVNELRMKSILSVANQTPVDRLLHY